MVELQYGKQFEPSSITEMFFRFNRDIVTYGEVRNPFEAFEMIITAAEVKIRGKSLFSC